MHRHFLTVTCFFLTVGCSPDNKPMTSGQGDLPGGLLRAEDPVVLTGAQVSSLGSADANDIVAFRRENESWKQIPLQVDERLVQDFCEIYGKSSGRWRDEPACKTSKVVTALFYADANTFTEPTQTCPSTSTMRSCSWREMAAIKLVPGVTPKG